MMPSDHPLVIVAEDDPALREIVSTILEEAGFRVLAARDGGEAVELLSKHTPDIMLTDLRMPVLDGYAVLETVRQSTPAHEIAVVIMSARSARADIRRGMLLGADDYLVKPFSPDELLHSLQVRVTRIRALRALRQARSGPLPDLLARPHTFRTPLNGVLGMSELMMINAAEGRGLTHDETREFGEVINESGYRLLRLFDSLSLLHELTVGRAFWLDRKPAWHALDWEKLVACKCREAAARHGRDPDLELALEGSAPAAPGDLLARVIACLVDNAFRVSRPHDHVRVTSGFDPGTWMIEIADLGPGFDPDRLERIRHGEEPTALDPDAHGIGVGLPCALAFAGLVGGTLDVSPGSPRGAVFRLQLPLASTAADADTTKGTTPCMVS